MRRLTYMVAAGAGLALTLAAGCGRGSGEHATVSAGATGVTGVTLATVATGNVPDEVDLTGTVRARTSAVLAARIAGTVTNLAVREGDRVRKGQLVVRLEAAENQAAVAGAEAGVEEARQALSEARARQKLAETTYGRFEKLFAEQAITRQEFDTRQTERDLANQGVARAEARLRQAEEGARVAGTMADYRRIVAPIAGVVTARPAALGATVFPGQPLLTIEGEGGYQLELAVPESLGAKVRTGTAVRVSLDGIGGAETTRVAEVVPAADPGSRTFVAKVNLAQRGLKSGQFGRGTVALGSGERALTVPRSALFERGALTAVWVVDKDKSARLRLVKPGKTLGDRVEILSGLSEGERVVSAGAEKVTDGARIQ